MGGARLRGAGIVKPGLVHCGKRDKSLVMAAQPVEQLAAQLPAARRDHRIANGIKRGQRRVELPRPFQQQHIDERDPGRIGPFSQRAAAQGIELILAVDAFEHRGKPDDGGGKARRHGKRTLKRGFGPHEFVAMPGNMAKIGLYVGAIGRARSRFGQRGIGAFVIAGRAEMAKQRQLGMRIVGKVRRCGLPHRHCLCRAPGIEQRLAQIDPDRWRIGRMARRLGQRADRRIGVALRRMDIAQIVPGRPIIGHLRQNDPVKRDRRRGIVILLRQIGTQPRQPQRAIGARRAFVAQQPRARLIAGAEQRIGQIGADHRVIGPHRLGAAQRRHRLIERATVAGNRAAERKQRHIVGA